MPKSSEFSLSIGELQLPLDITSIVQAQAGQSGTGGEREFSFRFRYRDIAFAARCTSAGGQATAHLSATLGVMPYSAESATGRPLMKEIHRGAVEHFGPIITLSQGRYLLNADLPLAAPITAVELIAELAKFLIPLKPYIDLMSMVRMMR